MVFFKLKGLELFSLEESNLMGSSALISDSKIKYQLTGRCDFLDTFRLWLSKTCNRKYLGFDVGRKCRQNFLGLREM